MSLIKNIMTNPKVENLVIIGSGPAGYTAAIYAGTCEPQTSCI